MESRNNFNNNRFNRNNRFSDKSYKKPQSIGYISNFEIPEEFNSIMSKMEEIKKNFHKLENQNEIPNSLAIMDSDDFILKTTKKINLTKTIMEARLQSRKSWLTPFTEKRDNVNVKLKSTVIMNENDKNEINKQIRKIKNSIVEANYEEKKAEIFKIENINNLEAVDFLNILFNEKAYEVFSYIFIHLYYDFCEKFNKDKKLLTKYFYDVMNKVILHDEEFYTKYLNNLMIVDIIIGGIFNNLIKYKFFNKKDILKYINLIIDNFENNEINAKIIRALMAKETVEEIKLDIENGTEEENKRIRTVFVITDDIIDSLTYDEIAEIVDKIKKSSKVIKTKRVVFSLMDIIDAFNNSVKNGSIKKIIEEKKKIEEPEKKEEKIVNEWSTFKVSTITENSNFQRKTTTISSSFKTVTTNINEQMPQKSYNRHYGKQNRNNNYRNKRYNNYNNNYNNNNNNNEY